MTGTVSEKIEHETKFIVEQARVASIIAWLNSRCRPDPLYPTGIVSSVYFDTPNWKFLSEKVNSDYIKTKIRVRWYSSIESGKPFDASFLEVKKKVGAGRSKLRVSADYSGQWLANSSLENTDLLKVNQQLSAGILSISAPVFPVFLINYKRMRWIEPTTGSRICVDYDINVPQVNSQRIIKKQACNMNTAVFELKGSRRELPPNLRQLVTFGCRKDSFSKYGNCYGILTRNEY